MKKVRVNITLDDDLSKFLKGFSLSQRLSLSELINQWALNLKRAQENQGMETILSSPEFYKSLISTGHFFDRIDPSTIFRTYGAGRIYWIYLF